MISFTLFIYPTTNYLKKKFDHFFFRLFGFFKDLLFYFFFNIFNFLDDLVDEAIKAINKTEDCGLFDSNTLQILEKSNELIPYLCAILRGNKSFSDEKSSRRRLICFQKLLFLLKNGKFNDEQGKVLPDR